MAIFTELIPFVLDKFNSGFYYTISPESPPPDAALYPSVNFDINQGVLTKRPGDQLYQPALQVLTGGRLQRTFDWLDATNLRHLFMLTPTTLYHYNDGTGNFDIFLSGLLGSTEIVPSACSFFGKIYFANGGNKLIQSDGTIGGTSIVATAPVLNAIIAFGGRVVGVVPPNFVKWSNTADAANWATGSAGVQPLDADTDIVQGIVRYRAQAMIGRLNSVTIVSLLDASPYYDFETLGTGIGTSAGASMLETPSSVLMIGPDNIYSTSTGAPQSIGGPRVERFVRQLNPAAIQRSIGIVNPAEAHVYFACPFASNTDITDILVYHYTEDHFEYWQKPNLTGLSVTQKARSITWSQLTSPWSSYTQPWSTLGGSTSTATTLFLKGDGVVYKQFQVGQDNGGNNPVTYTSVYRTALFNPSTGQVAPGQLIPTTTTSPAPAIIEMLEIISEPITATVNIRIGWSYGTSAVHWTPFRAANLTSGRVLLGFATREAPYWAIEIDHSNILEIPLIRRVTAWFRQRRRAVA